MSDTYLTRIWRRNIHKVVSHCRLKVEGKENWGERVSFWDADGGSNDEQVVPWSLAPRVVLESK